MYSRTLLPALNNTPVFVPDGEGRYIVTVELDDYALNDMDRRQRIDTWTTEHWTTINYYLLNSRNISLGHLLFRIPKEQHQEMFGDRDAVAKIELLEKRNAVISMTRV